MAAADKVVNAPPAMLNGYKQAAYNYFSCVLRCLSLLEAREAEERNEPPASCMHEKEKNDIVIIITITITIFMRAERL